MVGAEADITFADVRDRRERTELVPGTFGGGAVNRVLFYSTGGLAYGDLAVFPGSIMTVSDETSFHVIRDGVNFRFNT